MALYDGFGRVATTWMPDPVTGKTSPQPSLAIEYFLPADGPNPSQPVLPAGTPFAIVHVRTQDGATPDVASWRVLGGPAPNALSIVAQAPRSGFETAIALPAQAPGPVMTVQAIDRAGAVTGTAAPRRVTFGG